jgi:hypothetical protein
LLRITYGYAPVDKLTCQMNALNNHPQISTQIHQLI